MSAAHPVGRLRHRMTLESPVDLVDDNGGVSRTWTEGGTLWASIEPISMAHRFVASRDEQVVTHHILFRQRREITAAMRLRRTRRLFRILAIEDVDPATRFVRALCEEIKS